MPNTDRVKRKESKERKGHHPKADILFRYAENHEGVYCFVVSPEQVLLCILFGWAPFPPSWLINFGNEFRALSQVICYSYLVLVNVVALRGFLATSSFLCIHHIQKTTNADTALLC